MMRKLFLQQRQPMKSTEYIHHRQNISVIFSFVLYPLVDKFIMSIWTCSITLDTLTGRGMALFKNLTLNLRYLTCLFVISKILFSLEPAKLSAALTRSFLTPADLHASNLLSTTLRNSDFFTTYKRL